IKDYEDAGRPEEALPSVQWSLDFLIDRYLTAYDEVLANFPNRLVANGLRLVTHPLGLHTRGPSDRLSKQVSKLVTTPTQSREALLEGVFLDVTPGNPLGLVNEVFLEAPQFAELKRRVMKAAKAGQIARGMPLDMVDGAASADVISGEEAAALRAHLQRVMEIVHVDHFASAQDLEASHALDGEKAGQPAVLAEAS
ncbi:MAG: acyl-CoA dehydrogenase domain-containing protein, partial [Pseudomonadota bacterium]